LAKSEIKVSKPDPEAVRATFESVASRYDLANHFLSGGIDYYWREKLVEMALEGSCDQVLDLATGSGDVLFALRKRFPPDTAITGVDFCEPMLQKARNKRETKELDENSNRFLLGDCLSLDFPDESFDLVTISFGLRNLSDRDKGLKEMYRVLKPNGRLIVLEFSQPYFWFRPFYYFYLKLILPWMARLVTGDREAYLYLGSSISAFPDRVGLVDEFEGAGFERVHFSALTFSIVALHLGYKKNNY
jgi:demethylmenaquinone methyltransferase/2-methoxy-6-polyprenyl-1,4-benzoquinol methylase